MSIEHISREITDPLPQVQSLSSEKKAMYGSLLLSLPAAVIMIGIPFTQIYEDKPQEFVEGMVAFGGTLAFAGLGYAALRKIVNKSS